MDTAVFNIVYIAYISMTRLIVSIYGQPYWICFKEKENSNQKNPFYVSVSDFPFGEGPTDFCLAVPRGRPPIS